MWSHVFLGTRCRVLGLPDGEEIMPLAFFVLTQYQRVTDRRTDRHVAIAITRASIASRGKKRSSRLGYTIFCSKLGLTSSVTKVRQQFFFGQRFLIAVSQDKRF